MRILFIRHGDPDYVSDSLTEKGRREAELLAKIAPQLDLGEVYVSPMGRAQETASFSLKATGKQARTVLWLMEFLTGLNLNEHPDLREAYGIDTPLMETVLKNGHESGRTDSPDAGGKDPTSEYSYTGLLHPELLDAYLPDAQGHYPRYAPRIVWDILPAYAARHPELYDPEDWKRSDIALAGHVEECARYVFAGFDEVLKQHGYEREGHFYQVLSANEGTVSCFCHLGLTCLLVSHLMNISPFAAWEHFAFAPTSVTEFVTEERQKGTALFRALRLGDISHLTMGNEAPSFSGRFCETYENAAQRH